MSDAPARGYCLVRTESRLVPSGSRLPSAARRPDTPCLETCQRLPERHAPRPTPLVTDISGLPQGLQDRPDSILATPASFGALGKPVPVRCALKQHGGNY